MKSELGQYTSPNRQPGTRKLILITEANWVGYENQKPPALHDLLVLSLCPASLQRLLTAYDYARTILTDLCARGIAVPDPEDPFGPRLDLPVSVPLTLHSSAGADGGGWDLKVSDEWPALPRRFPLELLGPPNPVLEPESWWVSIFVRHQKGHAVLRLHTSHCFEAQPYYFESGVLPVEDLKEYQTTGKWVGEKVLWYPPDSP